VELATKFQDELGLETESGDIEQLPESIQHYLDSSPFEVRASSTQLPILLELSFLLIVLSAIVRLTIQQIQDNPGQEEVVMTRTFGDEM
jgi:complement component 1 Q subcomponent-binding protein